MKILIYTPTSLEAYGGAEVALISLAAEIASFGHRVVFLSGSISSESRRAREDLVKELGACGIKLIFASDISLKWLSLPNVESLKMLYSMVRWCDLVYFNECPGLLFHDLSLALVSKLMKKPVVAVHHDSVPFMSLALHNRLRYITIRKFFLRSFVVHHVVSRKYGEFLRKVGCARVVFIPNGVNLYRTKYQGHPTDEGAFKVFFVGRLSFEKGIDYLQYVVEEFNAKYPHLSKHVEFHIFGDGSQRMIVEQLAATNENVVYHGFLMHEQMVNSYENGHLLIMTSRTENMPLALIEAQSFGLPVVTFNTPTMDDLVREPIGKLVKPGDIETFTKSIFDFYRLWSEHPKDYAILRIQIKAIASKYDMTEISKKILRLFESILI